MADQSWLERVAREALALPYPNQGGGEIPVECMFVASHVALALLEELRTELPHHELCPRGGGKDAHPAWRICQRCDFEYVAVELGLAWPRSEDRT